MASTRLQRDAIGKALQKETLAANGTNVFISSCAGAKGAGNKSRNQRKKVARLCSPHTRVQCFICWQNGITIVTERRHVSDTITCTCTALPPSPCPHHIQLPNLIVMVCPTLPSYTLHPDENGIDINSWTICQQQNPIATSVTEQLLSRSLAIKLPTMLFDQSSLTLTYRPAPSNPALFTLTFTAVDALKMVGRADPSIRVRAAEKWHNKSQRLDVSIGVLQQPSDWTFSTHYPGTITLVGAKLDSLSPHWKPTQQNGTSVVSIDYDALRDTDIPILFASQVLLFEDELDDNGIASYEVRIRVMPTFFFILARFFLRVDGVLVRINDTRYFHRFGTDLIIRESVTREGYYATTLSAIHPSVLHDADMAAQKIPVTTLTVENIHIPT